MKNYETYKEIQKFDPYTEKTIIEEKKKMTDLRETKA
jgi:hypothetical protein